LIRGAKKNHGNLGMMDVNETKIQIWYFLTKSHTPAQFSERKQNIGFKVLTQNTQGRVKT